MGCLAPLHRDDVDRLGGAEQCDRPKFRHGNREPAAVFLLEMISLPSASPAMRLASCTPLPEKFRPNWVAPVACTPIRIFGANPCSRRCSSSRRWIATAHASVPGHGDHREASSRRHLSGRQQQARLADPRLCFEGSRGELARAGRGQILFRSPSRRPVARPGLRAPAWHAGPTARGQRGPRRAPASRVHPPGSEPVLASM